MDSEGSKPISLYDPGSVNTAFFRPRQPPLPVRDNRSQRWLHTPMAHVNIHTYPIGSTQSSPWVAVLKYRTHTLSLTASLPALYGYTRRKQGRVRIGQRLSRRASRRSAPLRRTTRRRISGLTLPTVHSLPPRLDRQGKYDMPWYNGTPVHGT